MEKLKSYNLGFFFNNLMIGFDHICFFLFTQCLELPTALSQPINRKIMLFTTLESTLFYIDNNTNVNKAKTQPTIISWWC